jgi:large subunit ribosomal protein L21
MYAIIRTGGKQYRVSAGDTLSVEKLDGQAGAELLLHEVLMVGEGSQVTLGSPLVSGASVKATVLAQGRGDKVRIFKMRRRKHYRKTQGHRQSFTSIRIDEITTGNQG